MKFEKLPSGFFDENYISLTTVIKDFLQEVKVGEAAMFEKDYGIKLYDRIQNLCSRGKMDRVKLKIKTLKDQNKVVIQRLS